MKAELKNLLIALISLILVASFMAILSIIFTLLGDVGFYIDVVILLAIVVLCFIVDLKEKQKLRGKEYGNISEHSDKNEENMH